MEVMSSEDRSTLQTVGTGAGTFSAADLKRRMAERQAARAAEELQRMREQEEKQKAVMEEFHKPPERSPDQLMQLVMTLVNRAAERADRGSGLSLSQRTLHRSRPGHQQLRGGLGQDAGGSTQIGT